MALAHYRLLHTSAAEQPKLLFEVKVDIQDVRSGYDGSRTFLFLAEWLQEWEFKWTRDMVREVSLEELELVHPPRPVSWPEQAEDLIADYVARLPGPQIWHSRELGTYSDRRESFEDFSVRCREGLLAERLSRMRNLSELFFHRFLRLQKMLLDLLGSEEGLDGNQRLGLETDLKRLFSSARESLSRIFLEDDFRLLQEEELDWSFPRRPEHQEHLQALASDLVRGYNAISHDFEERAKDIEPYIVPMGSAQVETFPRGVVWT